MYFSRHLKKHVKSQMTGQIWLYSVWSIRSNRWIRSCRFTPDRLFFKEFISSGKSFMCCSGWRIWRRDPKGRQKANLEPYKYFFSRWQKNMVLKFNKYYVHVTCYKNKYDFYTIIFNYICISHTFFIEI